MQEGDFVAVLGGLVRGYELVFFEGFTSTEEVYETIAWAIAPRGLL